MDFSSMYTEMKLSPPRFMKSRDYEKWRSEFEKYLAQLDPKLSVFLTTEHVDKDDLIMERKAYDTLLRCLSRDCFMLFSNKKTTYELWTAITMRFGKQEKLTTSYSDEGIKEKLLKKEGEIQALQSQILNMENEREQMRLTIVKLEEKVLEFEDQQKVMNKLQVDHDLAIKTVEALREQCDKASQSHIPPVEKKKKRVKRMSQFTTYSLQKIKNKICSEQSQSTKLQVDCCDHSGYSQHVKRSVSFQKPKEGFKPTTPPESRKTKSCVYTRAQMFALAPPRCHRMVQRRWKDFVPYSPRKYCVPPVPRTEFRYETTCFNFRWNSISLDYLDASYKRLSKISSKIGTVLKWVPKALV